MIESKEEQKSLLRKVKEESEKFDLKLSIQETKVMTFGPISSVQSLSCDRLFEIPWTTACQASLSIINSQNLVKLISIDIVIRSNQSILMEINP